MHVEAAGANRQQLFACNWWVQWAPKQVRGRRSQAVQGWGRRLVWGWGGGPQWLQCAPGYLHFSHCNTFPTFRHIYTSKLVDEGTRPIRCLIGGIFTCLSLAFWWAPPPITTACRILFIGIIGRGQHWAIGQHNCMVWRQEFLSLCYHLNQE